MSNIKFRNSDEYFEIQNVFCVGRNYADHITEMVQPGSNSDISKEPVVFLKTTSAIFTGDCTVRVPEFKSKKISNNLQNEVELVILIGKDGINIPEENAEEYIAGYAVGVDFTLRDIQSDEKAKGLPWTLSKSFINSTPVSEAIRKAELPEPCNLNIGLKVNGKTKQNGNTGQMIFSISYIIHYISSVFGLRRGDIIFTGTPSGVTKLEKGDIVTAYIENIGELRVNIG